jgi:hypothetical protein
MEIFEKRRFLIWGKTAPELSTKYYETVCTGAVFEDGTPIRIYPIPFRYMDEGDKFKKYQWITARIAKSERDTRPESYRIDIDSIEPGTVIPTDKNEWYERRQFVFKSSSWQFESVDALVDAQARSKQSLGVVVPQKILSVDLHPRSDGDEVSFEEKQESLRRRYDTERWLWEELAQPELKGLEFVKTRISVRWVSGSGKTHAMQIMDWEVIEQQRRIGDVKTLQNVREHMDLDKYAIRFFLGNIKQHPTSFTIVGLWYPKKEPGRLAF